MLIRHVQMCYKKKKKINLIPNPTKGHLFVVGQDQYPSMGRFKKPPFFAMGDPSSWWRDERTSTNSLWIKARDEITPHEQV